MLDDSRISEEIFNRLNNPMDTLKLDVFNMFIGKYLGSGVYRDVFEFKQDHESVVKIDRGENESEHPNIVEFETWHALKNTRWGKWLAPSRHIGVGGKLLIQARTYKIPAIFNMPKKIPSFLQDTHLGNFSLWNGNLVCHDYGMIKMFGKIKMVDAKWRD